MQEGISALLRLPQLTLCQVARPALRDQAQVAYVGPDHAIRLAYSERFNPVYSWCFRDESFLAGIAAIARSRHSGGQLEVKVMQLWLVLKALPDA